MSGGVVRALPPLGPEQAGGSDPRVHAWVSASAGAGKTQLLASRVLRLLLDGARPERILALTFTKAAAAEMQTRVLERLMHWAGAAEAEIVADLRALGLEPEAGLVARARTRFAAALDVRGGLQVQTIHAFAARLLAAFPLEAGTPAGFETLDDRTAAEIDGAALDALLDQPPRWLLDDLAALSIRHGESGLAEKLRTFGSHEERLVALGPPDGILPRLRRHMGLPLAGGRDALLADALARLDDGALRRLADLFDAHGGKDGPSHAAALRRWLALTGEERGREFETLAGVFLTGQRKARARLVLKAMCTADPRCEADAAAAQAIVLAAEDLRCSLETAELAAMHLRVAQALAIERQRIKSASGALAFDDIITRAARLLTRAHAAEWVRFKLDERIDHILVDEAQDTNADQWAIIEALSAEFFAGEGAGDGPRTLFAVGDYKQSIFGFQGADPAEFQAARDRLRAARVPVRDVPLAINFRSAPAVLKLVDTVIEQAGPEAFGLAEAVPPHRPFRAAAPGRVTLWQPVTGGTDGESEEEDSERGWISTNQRRMAARLAAQVKAWLAEPLWLPAKGRAVQPQDILILVRKRREFVGALVAALGQAGVPVAGADRLDLHAPIAAKDLKSLIRFVLQPGDDLSLAELLVSPLLGFSQDELFAVAYGRPGTLWAALQGADAPHATAAAGWLKRALAIADYQGPARFLMSVLSLPHFAARRRLLERLGADAREVVEEMVNAALAFEAQHPPSLEGFLRWLEAGEFTVKRDPDAPRGEVRVMTVHGAKGLQAPVVILADAAMEGDRDEGHVPLEIDGIRLPCFYGSKSNLRGPMLEAAAKRDRLAAAESMRLFYVALTRAEDMLFIGGALYAKATEPPPGGWWSRAEQALRALGAETQEAKPFWDGALTYAPPMPGVAAAGAAAVPPPARAPLPGWAVETAPVEARPPRPLAPSRLETDDAPRPPGPASAARRGRLLHQLFERAPFETVAGRRWLERVAPELGAEEREALLAAALGVIEHPDYRALFGPGSLAEAPVAAVLPSGFVVTGKVDRLLVRETSVHVVDFKTGARAPSAPYPGHVAQMAAYVAALARIFPEREICASLLYVAAPTLFTLAPETLAQEAAKLALNGGDAGLGS